MRRLETDSSWARLESVSSPYVPSLFRLNPSQFITTRHDPLGEKAMADEDQPPINNADSSGTHLVYGDAMPYKYNDLALEHVYTYQAIKRADWGNDQDPVGFGDEVAVASGKNKTTYKHAVVVAPTRTKHTPSKDGKTWVAANSRTAFGVLVYTEDRTVKLVATTQCTPADGDDDEEEEEGVAEQLRTEMESTLKSSLFNTAVANFNAVFMKQNTLGQKVMKVYVEGDVYDVMVADVGCKGEKSYEIRDANSYYHGRVMGATHLQVFGAQAHYATEGRWFLAELVSKKIEEHAEGVVVGPFSNGYQKAFSGDVWRLELGPVTTRHEARPNHQDTDGGQEPQKTRTRPKRGANTKSSSGGRKKKKQQVSFVDESLESEEEEEDNGDQTSGGDGDLTALVNDAVKGAMTPLIKQVEEAIKKNGKGVDTAAVKGLVEAGVKKVIGGLTTAEIADAVKKQLTPVLTELRAPTPGDGRGGSGDIRRQLAPEMTGVPATNGTPPNQPAVFNGPPNQPAVHAQAHIRTPTHANFSEREFVTPTGDKPNFSAVPQPTWLVPG